MSIDLAIAHGVLFGSRLEMAKRLLLPFCLIGFALSVKCLNLNFPLILGDDLNPGIMAHSAPNYTY